jgi:hypothetical protein
MKFLNKIVHVSDVWNSNIIKKYKKNHALGRGFIKVRLFRKGIVNNLNIDYA